MALKSDIMNRQILAKMLKLQKKNKHFWKDVIQNF